ncbi:MAG: T9SS type A sorting domain-containing protein [Flavobacteriales bacterium]
MGPTIRYVTCTLFLAAQGLSAQISYGGRAIGLGPSNLPEAPVVLMPAVDATTLLAEDAARAAQGVKGPYRFGFNHATDISMENSGAWHTLRNGDRLWRTAIQCPGAFSINFEFHEYVVPEGARVFVYNALGDQLGAFTAESAAGRHTLGVSQLAGDRITIEYHEPLAVAGEGRLRIGQVTHAYRDIFNMAKDLGESGSCNINVICPEGIGWENEIRSVAIITVGGSGFCTGTLLNNCAQDSTPYFLTANHCLDANVENWVFRFNWDSPVCDPTENGPTDQTVSGCELLVNSGGTDVALLRLNSIPPEEYNVYYSGWDHSATPAASMTGIHHPSGDIKKISHSDGPAVLGTFSGADCWRVQVWSAGTTEPGSSGSGLWNQDHRLVGQLFGGAAACGNSVDDYYGRLDVSWPLLEEWLGACGDTLNGWEPGETAPSNNDAAVTSITGVPALLCNSGVITPTITLKNNSTQVMTSITVTYGVGIGAPAVAVWNGSLQPGQTVNYTLPGITVPPGEHVLTVVCSTPNGQADPLVENDTWTHPFIVSNPGETVSLFLTPDMWGSDITWELTSLTGAVLYSGGPYPDFGSGITDTTHFCLTNACYVFTIFDEFGDGICCAEGNGQYEIRDTHGTQYAFSNGQYTDQNTSEFCVTVVGIAEVGAPASLAAYPNPTAGTLSVVLAGVNGRTDLTLFDGTGRVVMQRSVPAGVGLVAMDLAGLSDGIYLLAANHADGTVTQRVVVQR